MAANLEKRVDALERELRSLKSHLKTSKGDAWWIRLAGAFREDALFDEIVVAGQKYRRSTTRRNGLNSRH